MAGARLCDRVESSHRHANAKTTRDQTMNRLQTELQRLYFPHEPAADTPAATDSGLELITIHGQVRAMVVEVAQAAGWDGVASLWQGIQDELELPAPAMAVSGIDGYQVWLSLVEPIPVAQAQDFLESLCQRYLSGVMPQHIDVRPVADASAPRQARHARMVPALQTPTGHWSAFIAPGLASMFADEPWLDLPPSDDAQAKLLVSVQSIQPTDFQRAQQQLRTGKPASVPTGPAASAGQLTDTSQERGHDVSDPRRFLLSVMKDPGTELHLRIEAAKALLPWFQGQN